MNILSLHIRCGEQTLDATITMDMGFERERLNEREMK